MDIEVKHISKNYGSHTALKDVCFELKKHQITGFIGPNGAGKSTTFKILTGLIRADKGHILQNGVEISTESLDYKKKIGYLPENNPLYADLYIKEFLSFSAKMYDKKYTKKMDEVVEKTGLFEVRKKKISQLSKGYRQRVGLAQAIIHDPELIILDEPTSGLDPNQLIEIRKIIKELAHNKTIVLSSHIMQEVENICGHIIIIDKGVIVFSDNKERIKNQHVNNKKIYLEIDKKVNPTLWDDLSEILKIENPSECSWVFHSTKDIRKNISALCMNNHLNITSLYLEQGGVEEIFHKVTQ